MLFDCEIGPDGSDDNPAADTADRPRHLRAVDFELCGRPSIGPLCAQRSGGRFQTATPPRSSWPTTIVDQPAATCARRSVAPARIIADLRGPAPGRRLAQPFDQCCCSSRDSGDEAPSRSPGAARDSRPRERRAPHSGASGPAAGPNPLSLF